MADVIKLSSMSILKFMALLFVLLFLFLVFLWWQNKADKTQPYLPQKQVFEGINENGNYAKGSPDAKVSIYEFSDFQCPFCKQFYSEILGQLEQEYISTGKVRFVYKDFPLTNIHPLSVESAIAARCAGEQGLFWAYHNKLFENQLGISEANLKVWAKELGLNIEQFNSCYDARKYQEYVQRDLKEAKAMGLTGTPSLLINGELVKGVQPFSSIKFIIERKLNE
ncbi:DsbA family protein [Candidatus Woesearchaeota archaeon]|nr:DsbA family protein [Candidatus Woesearchaeota archaeon]